MAFYISGTTCDQFLLYEPELLNSFRELADTGQVDFIGSTATHSLVTLTNYKKELIQQIKDHQSKTKYLFGIKPRVFVNSDLIYTDLIGKDISDTGYKALITNSSRKVLGWRSPNYVYSNSYKPKMNIYFRNEQVSNELVNELNLISSEQKYHHPDSLLSLINNINKEEPLLNIYLDYKTLGGLEIEIKQEYLETLISQIIKSPDMRFVLPSEIVELYGAVAPINASEPICWVNHFPSNYYPGNELQIEAIKQLYMLQTPVGQIEDFNLQKDWQYLQTSDHIHLMDNQHPGYQNGDLANGIYKTKYDAFINFMNILDDFRLKLHKEAGKKKIRRTHLQESNKK